MTAPEALRTVTGLAPARGGQWAVFSATGAAEGSHQWLSEAKPSELIDGIARALKGR